jgi:hypothetical protein
LPPPDSPRADRFPENLILAYSTARRCGLSSPKTSLVCAPKTSFYAPKTSIVRPENLTGVPENLIAVRLQLHALAYNLANFLRTLALPEEVEHWSLTTLREKLVKIGARIVRHGRYVVFQLA